MKVIYIGGYGRSASTALELYLHSILKLPFVGEVAYLGNPKYFCLYCSCGVLALQCADLRSNLSNDHIDSSKVTRKTVLHLLKIYNHSDEFIFIWNKRHPYYVIKSLSLGSNRNLMRGNKQISRRLLNVGKGLIGLGLSWCMNRIIVTLLRDKSIIVNDIFMNLSEREKLNVWLLSNGYQLHSTDGVVNLKDQHFVGGNRMRNSAEQVKLKLEV